MTNKKIVPYFFIASAILLIDRFTKSLALTLQHEYRINQFLSFDLAFNRGINFGLFNAQGASSFIFINVCIALVIVGVMLYTIYCWRHNEPILGHILVLTGAVSNYYDRLFHGGVIDFILLWLGDWSWPAFNVADMAIVLGIGLMGMYAFTPIKG
jgi:signal peptidase II